MTKLFIPQWSQAAREGDPRILKEEVVFIVIYLVHVVSANSQMHYMRLILVEYS